MVWRLEIMAKAKQSLEEGLDSSANKRHLTGKERHRYIGGALHNMGKSKPRSGGKSHKASTPSVSAPRKQAYSAPTVTKKAAATTKKAYQSPSITKSVHLNLVARKNTEASKNKNYDVYSIYKSGEKVPHTTQTFRKMSAAKAEAKILEDESKEGLSRKRF
jgi:hypothetical protein